MNLLPTYNRNKNIIITKKIQQENIDAKKIEYWKQGVNKENTIICPLAIKEYLDMWLPNWSNTNDTNNMMVIYELVNRAKIRECNGLHLLPKQYKNEKKDKDKILEHKDAQKLVKLKQAINGNKNYKCSSVIKEYLDNNLPNWR